MSISANLALNSQGRETLRRRICEIAKRDPEDSANQDVSDLLRSLIVQWRPRSLKSVNELVDLTFPSRHYDEKSQCAIGILHIMGEDYEGLRGNDIPMNSVLYQRGSARHLNFVRGDLIEIAVTKLVHLTELEENKKIRAEARKLAAAPADQESSPKKTLKASPVLPTGAELLDIIRASLGPELVMIKTRTPISQNPRSLLEAIIQFKGAHTQNELLGSLEGKGCNYSYESEFQAIYNGRYTKNSKQFLTEFCALLKEFKPSPWLSPAVATKKMAAALGIPQVTEGVIGEKLNIGLVILHFMRQHKLVPDNIIENYRNSPHSTPLERYDTVIKKRFINLLKGDSGLFGMAFRETTVDSLTEGLLKAVKREVEQTPSPTITSETLAIQEADIGPVHVTLRTVAQEKSPAKMGVVLTLKSQEHSQETRYLFHVPKDQGQSTLDNLVEFMRHAVQSNIDIGYIQLNQAVGEKLKELDLVVPDKRGREIS